MFAIAFDENMCCRKNNEHFCFYSKQTSRNVARAKNEHFCKKRAEKTWYAKKGPKWQSRYLSRVGARVHRTGLIAFSEGPGISLTCAGWPTLVSFLRRAWDEFVCLEAGARECWARLRPVDFPATHRILQSFPECRSLNYHITGAFITSAQRSKFDDSLSVLECPGLDEAREPFHNCLDQVVELHPSWVQLPCMPRHPEAWCLEEILHCLPQPELNVEIIRQHCRDQPPVFFTDGSCVMRQLCAFAFPSSQTEQWGRHS